jgi:polar amino acid transport system substrate-binding protein
MAARSNRLVAAGLAAALMLGGVACGDDDGGDNATTEANGGSEGSGSSSESRTLNVCSDIPYAPMEMEGEGPRGLQYTGFDIELLDAMAEEIGAELEILDVEFDGILGNLAAGTCDVVASSVTIDEDRAKEVDFTEPYFNADQSLLVKADSGIESLDDLAGKSIGAQTGTTGEAYANENLPEGAQVKSFTEVDGLFGALESGDIDAILQDLPVNAGRAFEDDSVIVVETYPTDESYGFAVEKGSDLKGELDDALEAVRESGRYDEIYEKFFPSDD